ncbi:transporter substrate-binding domain-containing protein [Asticcacaulis sp. 201]|uniref:transporter substrate-binding domain-containing protein n=1 Tax=Asticcacaulis sp. 201 TaxID=3028787 RepID=UPI002915FA69|nr:transporter substrate-binding domain-containing protein [Asticcacaulis sp. 201]MDV6332687.1 transporter substrate-binding domain-containing protein [Asticcacaulis sp. 201]
MRAFSAFFVVIALLLSPSLSHAQDRTVHVSVRVLPPFVEQQNGQFSGFSIDLWNEIAKRRHWQSSYTAAPDVEGQLTAVSRKEADVGVGAVSITAERDQRFDFSQPILNGGFQILVRSTRPGPESTALESLLHLLFSPAILVWLGIACLLTIIPAHIIWLAERRHPEGMIPSKSYFPGIFQAFFWGMGTLATQADSMPRHWISRVVAVLWMFTSVVFVAFYTATLTATLTVQQFKSEINGPNDLVGKTVATVTASTSEEYLKSNGVRIQAFPDAATAYQALRAKKVDAVVYDASVLQYIAAHEGSGTVNVVGPIFHSEDYGFVFHNGSDLRRPVDQTLLSIREDGTYDRLTDKWFGKK